jgi:outer membrane protein OmpA-like peptidoglycan-associated protein
MTNTIAKLVLALAAVGCGGGQTLIKDPSPVMVSAAPPVAKENPSEPEPPPRVEVRADSIQVNEAIYFDSSRESIRRESHSLLDEIAKVINQHPELAKIRIEGHTDSIGASRSNLSLSKRRATSVRAYLVERGVDPTRLIAEGFGQDNPIADNATEEGRARNRRVAFTVLDRDDEVVAETRTEGGAS